MIVTWNDDDDCEDDYDCDDGYDALYKMVAIEIMIRMRSET